MQDSSNIVWESAEIMRLEITNLEQGIRLAKLVGRMDLKGTQAVDNEFALKVSSSNVPVIVDMSEVDFLASLGMRTLISAARGLKNHGSRMVIYQPQPLVREALETAGFTQLIPIADDWDEALIALTTP